MALQNYDESFGAVLDRWMKENGWSNLALSKACGISESSIRKARRTGINGDSSRPEPEMLAAICRVVGFALLEAINRVYNLDLETGTSRFSLSAVNLAMLYDILPPEQKELIWNVANTMAQQSGLPTVEEVI